MRTSHVIGILLGIALLVSGLLASRTSATTGVNAAKDLPASAVLRIDPRQQTGRSLAARELANAMSPLRRQLESRSDWMGLHARTASGATADDRYAQAQIYHRCAERTEKSGRESRSELRQRLAAQVAQDADGGRRLEAFDKVYADPCAGIGTLGPYSRERLKDLLQSATHAGSAVAQAWLLSLEMDQAMVAGAMGYPVTDEHLRSLRTILASGDPDAVREVQHILSSTIADGTFRLEGERVDPQAMHSALALLSCDLGAPCDSDSRVLLRHCALAGRCGASNLQDHVYFYDASPNQAQLMERYRTTLFGMVQRGDLSALGITREPVTSASSRSSWRGGY